MLTDSTAYKQLIPDTLKILQIDHASDPVQMWLPIVVVLVGGIITLVVNFLIARYQRTRALEEYKLQNQKALEKELFLLRLKAITEISEALYEAYHVTLRKSDGPDLGPFPSAYVEYQHLKDWNNVKTRLIDKNLILLDQNTYTAFTALNHLILKHLDEVEKRYEFKKVKRRDAKCREIGKEMLTQFIRSICP